MSAPAGFGSPRSGRHAEAEEPMCGGFAMRVIMYQRCHMMRLIVRIQDLELSTKLFRAIDAHFDMEIPSPGTLVATSLGNLSVLPCFRRFVLEQP